MAEKIVGIIYALWFIVPLIYSVLILLKVALVDWPKRRKNVSLIAIILVVAPVISIALFLIYDITLTFVFPNVEMPEFLNTLGLVLFFIYIGLFSGVCFGLGALGHGGISPSIVIRELYKLYKK